MRLVAALVLTFALSPAARAQSETSAADRLIDLRLEWLKQQARQDAATWESDLIAGPRTSTTTVASFGDPSAVLKELRPVLAGEYDAIRHHLLDLSTRARHRREETQKEWVEVCRQRTAFRRSVDEQQLEYGFNFDARAARSLQLTSVDAGLLLWAGVVLFIAWRLRLQEQRLSIRRDRRAVAAAVLLGLTAMPGCDGLLTTQQSWSDREQADLTRKIAEATDKATAATNAANARWQAVVDGWAGLVTAPMDSLDALIQREEIGDGGQPGLRDRLRELAMETRLSERLATDAEELSGLLSDERALLDDLVARSKGRSFAFGSLRIIVAAALFGITIIPFWSARRARRSALRQASRTCPRCFRRDTLQVESAVAESKPRYRGPKSRAKTVEEPVAEENTDREVRCGKCGLRMRRSYLNVPRLCFPTVGVRSSGKTHMMVTAYDRIRKRTAPTAAIVQPAPSGGDIDKRFDRLIEEILHRRGEAGATDLVLPDPILVHLKDCDPAGANSALINLFDYSGELINPDVDVNQLKATAVRMDGFMLFLDPTQLYGDGANVSLDEQLGMLDQFLAHMRKERQIPVGAEIPVPVAVCITKFDLLIAENPIGGQSVPFIRHLLNELNPAPRQMTLEVLKARSDLVEEMLPLIFTGVDIRGIVEGYFGKQVLFFPMSSVGLYEHELGIRDLSRRTIAPFGVAEPMMWLTYMHGYSVFEGVAGEK